MSTLFTDPPEGDLAVPLQTEEPAGPATPPEEGPSTPEERGGRRLLGLLLAVLFVAAVGLLVLLYFLLRPRLGPEASEGPGGYPIRVQTIIDGVDSEDRFVTPLGVAFDQDGNVWISDTGNGRVGVFAEDGDLVRVLGSEEGPGRMFAPYGIALDDERGRAYIADWGGGRVHIFSTTGAYIGEFPADDQHLGVFGPNGFSPYAVQVSGPRVFVTSNDGLYVFDDEGHVVERWGRKSRGGGLGMFNFPDALAVDPATGRTYVADTMNRRIVAIDADGRWLWVSGTPDEASSITGFWQLPRGVAVGPDGNLYIVDTFRFDEDGVGTGHIVVLSGDGELVSEFGRVGVADDELSFPEHIAVRPDGLFAIADRENNRVLLFRLDPLPLPDQKEASTYEGSVVRPDDVWATPRPKA